MADVTIQVVGLDKLVAKLGRMAAMDAMVQPMRRATERVRDSLGKYPAPPTFQGHATWMTPKQRRWFFANLRAGTIQVPYRRTGKLGQSWTTRVERTGTGLVGIVGNVRTYAPYVQDKGRQARIHQGRWPVAQDAIKQNLAAIVADFNAAIAQLLKK